MTMSERFATAVLMTVIAVGIPATVWASRAIAG